jgi:hypothetical protein
MPAIALGLLVVLYLSSLKRSAQATREQATVIGPPAPAPQADDIRPPQVYGDPAPVQTGRFVLSTSDKRNDQASVERLFAQASVNGWFIGANQDGSATIELRDINLEDAWVRLLSLDGVFVDRA